MRSRLLIPAALLLALAACDDKPHAPPRVIELGLKADSASGAIITSRGDTLYAIAQRYRLPLREIIDLNNLAPPYALADGQRLRLPPPADYRVRARDSLRSVAVMFGVSVSQLAALNGLSAPYALSQGQVLRLPMRHPQQADTADLAPPAPARPVGGVTQEVLAPPSAAPAAVAPSASSSVPQAVSGVFIWPVRGRIISAYGPKQDGLFNDGVNIAAPRGAGVVAARDGTVVYAGGDLKSYGNLVLIRHADGLTTAYAHLGSIRVQKGAAVRRAQVIGSVGSTGSVSASQLHFEIRRGAKTLDPGAYLNG